LRFHNAATKGCANERAVTRRGNGQHGLSERAAVDGARALPMLRDTENAKENADHDVVIIITDRAVACQLSSRLKPATALASARVSRAHGSAHGKSSTRTPQRRQRTRRGW